MRIGYARVSTDDQTLDLQRAALKNAKCREIYENQASGKRALDTELANACIDYLNYDRLSKAEVHTHLPGGGKQMQWFIPQHRVRRQLHLSVHDDHESRLFALAEQIDREPDELLKQALADLLSLHEAKTFGGMLASQTSPDNDQPLMHARKLNDPESKPLCAATDGPWVPRGFDFLRLTCHECKSLLLDPPSDTA